MTHLKVQIHVSPSIRRCGPRLGALHHLVVVKLYVNNSVRLDRLDHHALEVNR